MKVLEEELTEDSRVLRQLKREGATALYAVYAQGGVLYGYEVIRIRYLPAQILFGREYPEREAYPNNEQWGRFAWSWNIKQRDQAFRQFQNLADQYGNNYPGKEG